MGRIGVVVLILAMMQLGSAASAPETMDGYSAAHAAAERDWRRGSATSRSPT